MSIFDISDNDKLTVQQEGRILSAAIYEIYKEADKKRGRRIPLRTGNILLSSCFYSSLVDFVNIHIMHSLIDFVNQCFNDPN